MDTRLFAATFIVVFPYIFPLQIKRTLDVGIHLLRIGLHLGNMSVDIQGERGRMVLMLDKPVFISSPIIENIITGGKYGQLNIF